MFKNNFFKRLLSVGLCVLILLAAIPLFPVTARAATLEAVPEKDWTGYTPISNLADLKAIRDNPYGKYYLKNSLNLEYSYEKLSDDGKGWKPIGNGYTVIPEVIASQEALDNALAKYPAVYTYDAENDMYEYTYVYEIGEKYYYLDAFYGVFDGNGHTIKYLESRRGTESYGGLFGYNCGKVTGLYLFAGPITFKSCAGAIVGVNYGVITDCLTNKKIDNSNHDGTYFGGICGINYGYISGCYNDSSVRGYMFIGGIAGANFGTIRNCSNDSVHLNGNYAEGGIAGAAYNSVITECVDSRFVNSSIQPFLNETQAFIVGYDLSDEAATNYYRNCFYYYCANPQITIYHPMSAVGNISDSKLYGGPVTAKQIKVYMNEQSLGEYLDFENEWYSADDGKSYPMTYRAKLSTEISAVWDGTAVKEFAYGYGSGTKNDPYLIRSARQLAYVNKRVMQGETFEDTYFKLIADVEINDTSVEYWYKRAVEWKPIGDAEHPFKGNFDGDGYTVKGVYFNRCYETGAGLFGYLGEGAYVHDVNVECYIISYGDSGAVCGINDGGTIRNCNAYGYIDAYEGGGMVCGANFGKIFACRADGKLSGYSLLSGICAYNLGELSECVSNCEVVSCAYDVAGICAVNAGRIADCYNTGGVATVDIAGGICAENYGESISSCYNTGNIFASSYVGGVCAFDGGETLESCYYLSGCAKDALEKLHSGIGADAEGTPLPDIEGKTLSLNTDGMKKKESFEGFDFCGAWTMSGTDGYLYPELKCMIAPPSGDVNGDGVVNSIDTNLLKRYLSESSTEIDKYNADISDDRTLNAIDSNMLKRMVVGIN